MSRPCKVPEPDLLTFDTLPQRPSSMTGKKTQRSRVQRTNTVSGVTDQARKVLEELLVRGSQEKDGFKKEIPFSAPTPYGGPPSLANGHRSNFLDASSPLSDEDIDRVDGSHKRRPSHGVSTVLGDSSPSPIEHGVPNEVINRKKKTFFLRAKERLRETLRRQEKKPVTPNDDKTDLETPSVDKKHSWRFSLKRKKHKRVKGDKENDQVPKSTAASKKSTWRWSDIPPGSSISTLQGNRHSAESHPRTTSSEPAGQITSLPNSTASACDIRTTVPVRSRSADETRLQTLGPEQQAILRRYFSSAGKSRTSESKPGRSVTSAQQSASITAPTTKEERRGHHSLRKNLHLEGLVATYPTAQSVDGNRHKAPLAVPEDSHITPDEEEEDFIDGLGSTQKSNGEAPVLHKTASAGPTAPSWSDHPLVHGTTKPFSEKSNEEREELYSRIAEQLDHIGDSYCFGTSSAGERKADDKDASVTAVNQAYANFEMRRTASTSSLSEMTARFGDLLRNTDYDTFQRVVNRTIGSDTGIEQIAAMFRMTKCAVNLAGVGTSAAWSIKEMALRYFKDHFATWVVKEGGWESVVEDSTTDMELD